MTFYEYFLWLCRSKQVTAPQAYNAMGLNRGTISRWKSAYTNGVEIIPSTKAAIAMSKYFKIPVENIFKKEDEFCLSPEQWEYMGHQFHNELVASGKKVSEIAKWSSLSEMQIVDFASGKIRIPASQLDVLCGVLGTNAQYLFAPWADQIYNMSASDENVLEKEEPVGVALGDFYLPVMNNAFPPSNTGDLVAVHEQVTAENGDLVVVELNGSRLLRRFERIGDTVLLRCDNPNYQTIVLSGDEAKGIRIIGKATYFIIKAV